MHSLIISTAGIT